MGCGGSRVVSYSEQDAETATGTAARVAAPTSVGGATQKVRQEAVGGTRNSFCKGHDQQQNDLQESSTALLLNSNNTNNNYTTASITQTTTARLTDISTNTSAPPRTSNGMQVLGVNIDKYVSTDSEVVESQCKDIAQPVVDDRSDGIDGPLACEKETEGKVMQTKNREQLVLSEEQAATKIQAGVRGYKVRKDIKAKKMATREKAATKIQAGVRGYKVRKDIKAKKMAATKKAERGHSDSKGTSSKERNPKEDPTSTEVSQNDRKVNRKSIGAESGDDDVFEKPADGMDKDIIQTSKNTTATKEMNKEVPCNQSSDQAIQDATERSNEQ